MGVNKKAPIRAGAGANTGPVPQVAAGVPGRKLFIAGAAVSFLVGIVLYLRTMVPTAPFWDSGEFIATSYILGIPHSPGTPLYILLGRVFTLLPIPLTIAGKVNFISALCGALGGVALFVLVVRFLDDILGKSASIMDTAIKVAAGLVGALFILFSDSYWTNATEAEVYALSAFLMGFMTWLGLKWEANPNGQRARSFLYLLFYLLALSVGFHLGTLLAFSGIFFLVLMTKSKSVTNLEFIVASAGVAIFVADATLYRQGMITGVALVAFAVVVIALYARKSSFALVCAALFLLGLSVHLYLIIRSGLNPAIDEGSPETWRALYATLRREQYPPPDLFARKASFSFQLEHFFDYFQQQFALASQYVGRLNLGSVIPLGLGIWGIVDHFSKHKKSFTLLMVTFLATSLGLVIYLNFSSAEVRERDYFYSPAFYYFAVFIGIGVASLLSEIRGFARRRGIGSPAVIAVPAFVFLVFPVLTARYHFFAHDRSRNYVCQEYAKNMFVGLDEDAIVFTNGDNDTFPLWYIQEVEHFRRDIRVVNLSLLNTPWYIEQLRDNEPKIPIAWTDEQLNRLEPVRTKDGWLLVRDLAVRHILKETKWTRPIYFAVTIPPEIYAPYRDYLEMQGLAYRVVSRRGKDMIDEALLEENIWRRFNYRSILTEDWKRDDSIYLQPFIRRLVQNYAAAFTQLGFLKYRQNDYAGAVRNLEVAYEIAPDLEPVMLWLGWYYLENGDTAMAINFYEREARRRPDRTELLYRLAGVYERIGDLQNALETLDELIKRDPEDRDAVVSAVGISIRFNFIDRAKKYIVNWLAAHPGDQAMRKMLEELKAGPAPNVEDRTPKE